MTSESFSRKLAAILYADVAGYSRLTGADEEGTHRRLSQYLDHISACVEGHGGRIVHYAGDAVLSDFPTVSAALRCAIEIQEHLASRNESLPEAERIRFRIGVNLGEVIEDRGDIYGDGVNVAARLEALAEPGGICVSESVRAAAGSNLPLDFTFNGERKVKNIEQPLRVYTVTSRAAAGEGIVAAGGRAVSGLPAGAERPTIAVLPFQCIVGDRALEYLALGLTEDVTTLLARIPGFLVISRASAFAYKGQRIDAPQVARELGVRYVVEGSLRPVGRDVRLSAQLVDAEADAHLWAERFDRPSEEVLDLQDEITQAIVGRIEPELARAELSRLQRRPAENLAAWDLYQRAHGLLSLKGWAASTFEEAIDLLRQAIALDEEFALAHAYLSLLLAISHMFQLGHSTPPFAEQAVAEVNRAVDLDGRDSSVLGYAGCALCDIGQNRRGIELLERAIESDPSNAQAWAALGVGLIRLRKAREGIEKLRHGIRISPMDTRRAYWGAILANALFRLRDYDEALKEAQLACRRNDRFANSRVVLAMILTHRGCTEEAAAEMEEARRIFPDLAPGNVTGLIGNRGVRLLRDAGLLE